MTLPVDEPGHLYVKARESSRRKKFSLSRSPLEASALGESSFSAPQSPEEANSHNRPRIHQHGRYWSGCFQGSPIENWLACVVCVTLVSATIQLGCGLYAHSLALLSDLSHAILDVISYFMNWFCERLKGEENPVRGASRETSPLRQTARASRRSVARTATLDRQRMFDVLGSSISMLTLFGCTVFVITEAARHLHAAIQESESNALRENQSLFPRMFATPNGFILFAFSLADTVATMVLLIVAFYKGLIKTDARGLFNSVFSPCPGVCNLNVSATCVHLAADAVRGVSVLISAVYIWNSKTPMNSVIADSVAALLIALLVFLGMSPMLYHLGKTYVRLYQDFMGGGEEDEDELGVH